MWRVRYFDGMKVQSETHHGRYEEVGGVTIAIGMIFSRPCDAFFGILPLVEFDTLDQGDINS
jgi:hypothetical protein